jgi:sugar lactone lactonase YvrE
VNRAGWTTSDEDVPYLGFICHCLRGCEEPLLAQVDVASTLVTNCAFGGSDLSTLYITCAVASYDESITGEEPLAGSLFKADVGAQGRLQNNFVG